MTTIPIRHRSLHVEISEPTREEGRKDVTLFFIHGSMASLEQWRHQIEAVRPLFRVVSYDYFGCGKSPRLTDSWESYSTEEHLADLLELFDTQKTAHNVLIGHSFGTNQVLRVARERGANHIAGIVLVAPALMKDGGHPIFFLPEFVLNWMQPTLSQNFMQMALHPETREMKTDAHKALMAVALARSNTNSMHVAKSFYRQIKFVREETVTGIDGKIPVLVICGSEDILTPMPMAEKIIEWLNNREGQTEQSKAQLEIIGPASHQVMEEQYDEVNKCILKFMGQLFPTERRIAAL